MKKSFKKAIAVLLAVLMIALSVPYTAFAAPGDYAPNFDVQFGTFHDYEAASRTEVVDSATAAPDLSACGLFDAPLEYDYELLDNGLKKSGYLRLDADKANTANDALGMYDAMEEDYTYGVGDYFTVTVTMDNVNAFNTIMLGLGYSDNIEPAGVYRARVSNRNRYFFGTQTECDTAGGTWITGPILDDQSAITFYPGVDELTGTTTTLRENSDGSSYIWLQKTAQDGSDAYDISSVNNVFADPETGAIDWDNGYTYEGKMLVETFIFKITGEGPIEFSVNDPDNSKQGGFQGGAYIYANSDGIMSYQLTTYAPNYFNADNVVGDTEAVGSSKMTIFGKNVNVQSEEPACTHTSLTKTDEVPATCTTAGTAAYWTCDDCGKMFSDSAAQTEISAPVTINAKGHSYGDWTYDGADQNTHTKVCANDASHTETEACQYVENVVKPPTYTESGETTYTCSVCGGSYTTYPAPIVCEHNGETHVENAKAATCEEAGYTGDTVCDICGDTIETGTTIDALGHAYGEWTYNGQEANTHTRVCANDETHTETGDCDYEYSIVTPPTVTAAGEGKYTCKVCGGSYTVTLDPVECEHDGATHVENAKAATCEEAGYTGDTVCDICGDTIATGTEIQPLGHAYGDWTYDGEEANTHTRVCANDPAHTETDDCDYEYEVVTEPSYTADGEGKYTCKVCGGSYTVEIPQLTGGVDITVTATDLGTTAINETDSTNGATVTVAKDSTVTLTAAPVDGATFVGWALNNKIVSNDAVYTTPALSDATYTAVFTETADATFTVVFVDNYGNVIDTQTVASAADITEPEAPARPGYTFTGWSVDYTTLTEGATVVAQYTKDAAATYTVTADGCTITAGDTEVTDVLTSVAYDTKVTVTADGATSWKIGDATVAYGESYTFYVGSDVTVVPQFDAVTATPTVSAVSVSDIDVNGLKKAVFLATRSMTDDCTYVASGYIYGANGSVTADTTLDDVDGTTIKRSQAATAAEQFSIGYGLRAQTGTIEARAYLVYVDAGGVQQVIYAEVQTYTYD